MESASILASVGVVVAVTAGSNLQKERQFRALQEVQGQSATVRGARGFGGAGLGGARAGRAWACMVDGCMRGERGVEAWGRQGRSPPPLCCLLTPPPPLPSPT